LDTPSGYALPLSWDYNQQSWHSGPWEFRNETLFLIPGDSPMGLRLPLGSLPWQTEEEREVQVERDGMEELGELGDYASEVDERYSATTSPKAKTKAKAKKTRTEKVWVDVPHTALSIEARNGCLTVFMPPLTYLEHYLDLIAAVEATAAKLETPVRVEGYPPPRDYRVTSFAVTPDPGVIEVNIHPAKNWKELVTNTEILYEEARLTRLGTEKFMHDGRHTGTGGGNHVTLGAAQPTDSPFLRRPEVLQSLITYWQHHPALSYLFSGLFIGPTSQAPRVDEGRDEKLYELDIAFSQMPQGETDQPWLVDRLLRHLLTDLTGNTHRSEFCIDKMYSPDSASGRQGILEFRGFEMPPHARMSLMQGLLIRALVAKFWREPYKKPLVRWGTELHDRFMLRHYIESDMRDVVRDLNDAGYDFRFEWLAPFLEFRFPRFGSVQLDDISIHVHGAIEPWHVLGEESGSQGTARYVDSSLERVQVTVQGVTDSRYILVCNGQRVPLKSTGKHGEFVAGIRYRAWNPPSALHPTIGVHAPLVIDLVDTWNDRSVGGCTYHVAHPGGLNPESPPINALEAESRRISRFWEFGHSPVSVSNPGFQDVRRNVVPHESSRQKTSFRNLPYKDTKEYPYTLDLRNIL
jgi:uncharacterized protein (DUF2126 family)